MKRTLGKALLFLWVVGWLLVLAVFASSLANAQTANPRPLVIWPEWVEQVLADKYRETQVDTSSLEYAACLSYERRDSIPGIIAIYQITGVRFPAQTQSIMRDSTWTIENYGVSDIVCNWASSDTLLSEPLETMLHSHSCIQHMAVGETCTDSIEWKTPSDYDWRAARRLPFAVIQYADTGFHVYYSLMRPRQDPQIERKELPPPLIPDTLKLGAAGFGLGLLAGVVLNRLCVGLCDRDDGQGPDQLLAQDKAVHGAAASALTFTGISSGLRPWTAAGIVCAAGALFEFTQGHESVKDMGANCVGAAATAVWWQVWR